MVFDKNKSGKLRKTSKYLTSNIKFLLKEDDLKNNIIYLSYINDESDDYYFTKHSLTDFSYTISLYNFWLKNEEKIYKDENIKYYLERCEEKSLNVKLSLFNNSIHSIYGYFAPLLLIPNDKPTHFVLFKCDDVINISNIKSLNDIRNNLDKIKIYKVFNLENFFSFENELFYKSGENVLTYIDTEKRYFMNVVDILKGTYNVFYINEDELISNDIEMDIVNLLFNKKYISRNFYNIEFLFEDDNLDPRNIVGFYCKYNELKEFIIDENKTYLYDLIDKVYYRDEFSLENIDLDSENDLLVLRLFRENEKQDDVSIVKNINLDEKFFILNEKLNLDRYKKFYFLVSNILSNKVINSIKFSINNNKFLNISNWIEIEYKRRKYRFILSELSRCICAKKYGINESKGYSYEIYNFLNLESGINVDYIYKIKRSNKKGLIVIEMNNLSNIIFDEGNKISIFYNNNSIDLIIDKIEFRNNKGILYISCTKDIANELENINKFGLYYRSDSYEYCYVDIGVPHSTERFYLSFKEELKRLVGLDSVVVKNGIIIYSDEEFNLTYDFTKSYYKYGNVCINNTTMKGVLVDLIDKVEYRIRNKNINSIINNNYKVALIIDKDDLKYINKDVYICYYKDANRINVTNVNLPDEIIYYNGNIINLPDKNNIYECGKCINYIPLKNEEIYVQPYIYDKIIFNKRLIGYNDEDKYLVLLLDCYPIYYKGINLYKRKYPMIGYMTFLPVYII